MIEIYRVGKTNGDSQTNRIRGVYVLSRHNNTVIWLLKRGPFTDEMPIPKITKEIAGQIHFKNKHVYYLDFDQEEFTKASEELNANYQNKI